MFFSKTAVLIVNNSTRAADDTGERIEAFFKNFDSGSQLSTITAGRPSPERIEILRRMKWNKTTKEMHGIGFELEDPRTVSKQNSSLDPRGLRNSTEMTSDLKTKEELENEIKQLDEEVHMEKENFQMELLTTLNQWIEREGWLKLKLVFYIIIGPVGFSCCIKSVFYALLVEESCSTIFASDLSVS